MANTFTSKTVSGVIYWDFKISPGYQLTLSEANIYHNAVIGLLNDAVNATYYRQYLEELAAIEISVGIRPALAKFVETFKATLGFDTIPDPVVPPEIDPGI
jgi:hypothetical protein